MSEADIMFPSVLGSAGEGHQTCTDVLQCL